MRYLLEYATDTFTGGSWAAGNGDAAGLRLRVPEAEAADTAIPGTADG